MAVSQALANQHDCSTREPCRCLEKYLAWAQRAASNIADYATKVAACDIGAGVQGVIMSCLVVAFDLSGSKRDSPSCLRRLTAVVDLRLLIPLNANANTLIRRLPQSLDRSTPAVSTFPRDATPEPVAVIRNFYRALDHGNVAGILALLHDNISWTEAEGFPYYSGTWEQPQAVRDNLLAPLKRDWYQFTAAADDFVVDGNTVVVFGCYSGTYKKTGKSMVAAFAHRWTVVGGKIATFRMYTDTAKVLESMH